MNTNLDMLNQKPGDTKKKKKSKTKNKNDNDEVAGEAPETELQDAEGNMVGSFTVKPPADSGKKLKKKKTKKDKNKAKDDNLDEVQLGSDGGKSGKHT